MQPTRITPSSGSASLFGRFCVVDCNGFDCDRCGADVGGLLAPPLRTPLSLQQFLFFLKQREITISQSMITTKTGRCCGVPHNGLPSRPLRPLAARALRPPQAFSSSSHPSGSSDVKVFSTFRLQQHLGRPTGRGSDAERGAATNHSPLAINSCPCPGRPRLKTISALAVRRLRKGIPWFKRTRSKHAEAVFYQHSQVTSQ